jgi:hypothetical protein
MAKGADVFPATETGLSPALHRQLEGVNVLVMPTTIIADNRLTPGAKFLYSVLLKQSWNGESVCATHAALAHLIGASVRATRNYIDELTAAKLLTMESRAGKPSCYRVTR